FTTGSGVAWLHCCPKDNAGTIKTGTRTLTIRVSRLDIVMGSGFILFRERSPGLYSAPAHDDTHLNCIRNFPGFVSLQVPAQDASAILSAAAKTIGSDDLRTIQYSGSGFT